jgi:hypothetical protein
MIAQRQRDQISRPSGAGSAPTRWLAPPANFQRPGLADTHNAWLERFLICSSLSRDPAQEMRGNCAPAEQGSDPLCGQPMALPTTTT